MKNNWKKVKLSDCVIFKNGKKIPNNIGNIPIYGGNGILGYSDKYNAENCVIIGRVGTCGSLYKSNNKCWVSDNAIVGTAKENININYMFYLMQTLQLNKRQIGTVQPLLTQNILNNIDIKIPDLQTQQKIAEILSSLDDKIELNNRINRNLEEQAQAIFKNWFMDFAPFGGKMPSDWHFGSLKDIANITMGQSPDGHSYNENKKGTVFFQGRTDFGFRFPKTRLYTTEPKRIANANDILMSVRAPVGDINIAIEKCCIGRGLAAINPKKYNSFVLYTVINAKSNLDVFNAEGTVFGSINTNSLNNLKVLIPKENFMKEFNSVVSVMDEKIKNNCIENEKLADIRDTLLPKLMTGEFEIEK